MSVVIRRIISHLCELTEIFKAFFERYMNTVYNPFPMKCDNFYFSTPPDALFSENRLPPTLPLHLSRKSHAYWVFFLRFVMIWLLRLQGWLFVRLFNYMYVSDYLWSKISRIFYKLCIFWSPDYREFEISQIVLKVFETRRKEHSGQWPSQSLTISVFRAVYIFWKYLF